MQITVLIFRKWQKDSSFTSIVLEYLPSPLLLDQILSKKADRDNTFEVL